MDKKYIHYGHTHFDRNLFIPIKNRKTTFANKPIGGFWASPLNSAYDWRTWNSESEFRPCHDDISFTFTLSDNARILVLDKAAKVKELPMRVTDFPDMFKVFGANPDFEKLVTQFDAIEYVLSKDPALYDILYGWDCDSILIMNPDIIREIKKEEAK